MLRLITLAAIVAFGTASAAAQVTSIEASRPDTSVQNPDKVTCERVEKTGTRLGARRICMTEEQWAAQRREQRDDLERVQRIVNQAPSR